MGSTEMVEKYFPEVKLIRLKVNDGYAAACNKGFESSSGDFVLMLNPDTLVEPDTFTNCLHFMNEHSEAGAVGSTDDRWLRSFPSLNQREHSPSPVVSFFRISGLGLVFRKSPVFNRYYLGQLPDDQLCKSDILTGAFMFIRREAPSKSRSFLTHLISCMEKTLI